MRIGSSFIASPHAAGMSALWHDPDLLPPERELRPTAIWKGIQDLPLPTEEHQLPEGIADPFERMEAYFDVAAEQMERGIRGLDFLNGKRAPEVAEPRIGERAAFHYEHRAREEHVAMAGPRAIEAPADHDLRAERGQLQRAARAGVAVPQPANAVVTAARREAEQHADAMHTSEALGLPAVFAPLAVGQLAHAPAVPTVAANAASIAGVVATSGELVAAGVQLGLGPERPGPRRGLRMAAPLPAPIDWE